MNEKLDDYINSLENEQMSKGQEALLLVGGDESFYGGSNSSCENRSSSCDLSINKKKCTNGTGKGCVGSINGTCTKVEFKETKNDDNAV